MLGFYGDVFGWQELPTLTVDGKRLGDDGASLRPVRVPDCGRRADAPRTRSISGQSVASHVCAAALRDVRFGHKIRDDRVDVIDLEVEEYPGLRLHSFYVGFLLPMMIESQYWEWTA